MTKNSDYIKATFIIYEQTLNRIISYVNQKGDSELFAKLIELNNKHLIENLDKALVLFKEEKE